MKSIYDGGSIVFDLAVYRDFMSYKTGVYTPVDASRQMLVGYHSTACFGFGQAQTPVLLCKNSWGPWWGEGGNFRINPNAAGVLLNYVAIDHFDLEKSLIPPL